MTLYVSGKGLAACREKRLEGSVQLRKRRREETLARLRHLENTAEEEVLKQRAVYDDTLIAELFDDDDAIKALWTYHAHMKPGTLADRAQLPQSLGQYPSRACSSVGSSSSGSLRSNSTVEQLIL